MDPDVVDGIISEGTYMIPKVTYNNLNVDSFSVDAETKKVYYGVTASPAMKAGLSVGNLAWWNTLLAGVAIAGATVLTGGIGGIVLFQLGLASSGAGILGAC